MDRMIADRPMATGGGVRMAGRWPVLLLTLVLVTLLATLAV